MNQTANESAAAGSEPASRDHHTRWSRGAPARTPAARALATVVVAAAISAAVYVLSRVIAPPGVSAASAMLTPDLPASVLATRVLLCAALATCGGIALARPAVGPTVALASSVRRWMWTSTGLGVLACVSGVVTDRGAREWSVLVALLLVVTAIGVARANRPLVVAAVTAGGVLLAVVAGIVLATASTGLDSALDIVYVLASTVLIGVSVHARAVHARTSPGRITDLAGLARRAGLGEQVELVDLAESAPPGGSAVSGAPAGPSRELVGSRLFGTAALAATVAAAAAAARLAVSGPGTWYDLWHTTSAWVVVAQWVLPLGVLGLWSLIRPHPGSAGSGDQPAVRTAAGAAARGGWVVAAALTTVAVLLAAARATLPTSPAAPVPGQVLLRPVTLGAQHLAVLVAPMRPGLNLVHIGASTNAPRPVAGMGMGPNPQMSPDMSSGADTAMGHGAHAGDPAAETITVSGGSAPVTASPRPGAPGLWAVVNIPLGAQALTVTTSTPTPSGADSPVSASVPVDVGDTPPGRPVEPAWAGPDGPECASAALGAVIAQATPASVCPADGLSATDAASLTQTVAFLAQQRLSSVSLASDDSPRSRAAASVVREQAARWHIALDPTPVGSDSVIVVTGWAGAPAALHSVADRAAHGSTGEAILAPWLAVAPVLGQASSETVALTFNPQSRPVREYAATLRAVFPTETPSPAGYLAWAAQVDPSSLGSARFYGAAQVNVPMGGMMDFDMNPNGVPGDWYPGGTIVPIN